MSTVLPVNTQAIQVPPSLEQGMFFECFLQFLQTLIRYSNSVSAVSTGSLVLASLSLALYSSSNLGKQTTSPL